MWKVSYHTDAHRTFYTMLRRTTKAPTMIVVKTTWGWYAEVKETGQKLFEQRECDCSWCAKAEAIHEWMKIKVEK